MTICSYSVNSDIGVCGAVVERGGLPEVFSELMLPDIKADQLSANVVHLLSLQWGHILLHHYRLLLHIVPLLRKLLCT